MAVGVPECGLERLILQTGRHGRGVFATERFSAGDDILPFVGPRYTRREIPAITRQEDDMYLQVGDDLFMGPSGGLDDFVNHSCDPNAGLRQAGARWTLIAIRTIEAGEEVTFDYSSTMHRPVLVMRCACGSPGCRGQVDSFVSLPDTVQRRYLDLGIVPDYLR